MRARRQKERASRRIAPVPIGVLAAGMLFAFAALTPAAIRTRACEETSPGYPVQVRASRNVSCAQARHVM